MQELKDKVAIVTGATRKRGLGRAIALTLAAGGANVVVTGNSRSASKIPEDEASSGWRGLPDVVEQIEALGVRGLAVYADVTNQGEVEAMVRQTVEHFGKIDILINNATYPRGSDRVPLVDLDVELWRKIVDVNLTGTMIVSKYVAKQMILQGTGGSIIGISSGAAMKAAATFSAYAASKSAMHNLSGALADELGPHGITCNIVAPGFLNTARIDMLRATEELWAKRLSTLPIKRPGTPEDVAELVRYLCGPHARWITGEVVMINGGEVRRAAR